jgi:hypothetical protein
LENEFPYGSHGNDLSGVALLVLLDLCMFRSGQHLRLISTTALKKLKRRYTARR